MINTRHALSLGKYSEGLDIKKANGSFMNEPQYQLFCGVKKPSYFIIFINSAFVLDEGPMKAPNVCL